MSTQASGHIAGLCSALTRLTLQCIVAHETPWDPVRHWRECGQSCPCCRACNDEDFRSGCDTCMVGFTVARVSAGLHRLVATIPRCSARMGGRRLTELGLVAGGLRTIAARPGEEYTTTTATTTPTAAAATTTIISRTFDVGGKFDLHMFIPLPRTRPLSL